MHTIVLATQKGGSGKSTLGDRLEALTGTPHTELDALHWEPGWTPAEPEIFRPVPGGWGKGGATNVRLAKADATTLKSALTMAWQNIAGKSQARPRRKKKA